MARLPSSPALRVAVLALTFAGPRAVQSDPPATVVPGVVLKSGKLVRGRVAGTVTAAGNVLLELETDFGRFLVPRTAVDDRVGQGTTKPETVFVAAEIRVRTLRGRVDVRRHKTDVWLELVLPAEALARASAAALAAGPTAPPPDAPETPSNPSLPAPGPSAAPAAPLPTTRVEPGDSLRTGPDAEVELFVHKDVWLRVSASSEIEIARDAYPAATLALLKGSVLPSVAGRPRGETFAVRTPSAVLGVKGTLFEVRVIGGDGSGGAGAGERAELLVGEGEVTVGGRGSAKAGQHAAWEGDAPLTVRPLTPEERARFPTSIPSAHIDDMALVPAGLYELSGHSYKPSDPKRDWAPRRGPTGANHETLSVRVLDFLIDRRKTTEAQLSEYLAATRPGVPPPERDAERTRGSVTWREASEYALWCAKILPSEGQWEIAARGPEGLLFPWGHSPVRGRNADESAYGVLDTVSDPPEWCRDDFLTSPFMMRRDPSGLSYYRPEEGVPSPRPGLEVHVIRGTSGSTRWRIPGVHDALPQPPTVLERSSRAGVRLVRKL